MTICGSAQDIARSARIDLTGVCRGGAGLLFRDGGTSGAVPGQGHIAQQFFWYSAFTHALSKPGLPVMNADG
jgi:hypothetical protein